MFRFDENGAKTTDWMIVVSAIAGLGGAAILSLSGGAENLALEVQTELESTDVEITPIVTGLGENGHVTSLQGIQYASHFGNATSSGGTISQQTAHEAIHTLNDNTDDDLLAKYAGLFMTDRRTNEGSLDLDIAYDLLVERGYVNPDLSAPLYNTQPTSFTIMDFKHLWDGDFAVVDKNSAQDFLNKLDGLHDVHFVAYVEKLTADWQRTIYNTLEKERGLEN